MAVVTFARTFSVVAFLSVKYSLHRSSERSTGGPNSTTTRPRNLCPCEISPVPRSNEKTVEEATSSQVLNGGDDEIQVIRTTEPLSWTSMYREENHQPGGPLKHHNVTFFPQIYTLSPSAAPNRTRQGQSNNTDPTSSTGQIEDHSQTLVAKRGDQVMKDWAFEVVEPNWNDGNTHVFLVEGLQDKMRDTSFERQEICLVVAPSLGTQMSVCATNHLVTEANSCTQRLALFTPASPRSHPPATNFQVLTARDGSLCVPRSNEHFLFSLIHTSSPQHDARSGQHTILSKRRWLA